MSNDYVCVVLLKSDPDGSDLFVALAEAWAFNHTDKGNMLVMPNRVVMQIVDAATFDREGDALRMLRIVLEAAGAENMSPGMVGSVSMYEWPIYCPALEADGASE